MTVGPALDTAVRAVLGPASPQYSLAVWHGFTPELLMSVVALAGGVARVFHAAPLPAQRLEGPPAAAPPQGPADLRAGARHPVVAAGQMAGGPPRHPASPAAAAAAGGRRRSSPPWRRFTHGVSSIGRSPPSDLDLAFALVWAVGIACALGAAYQAKFHRLAALILLGGAGLVTCISFVWLSAPDLALTQLVVETVTTVLLLLGLRWLPKRIEGARARRAPGERDPMVSRPRLRRSRVGAGAGLATLAYAAMTRPAPDSISRFFVENAYTQGGGTNIVNVILVDFRGFDTLGEITVLGVVALTVYALLRRFRPAPESIPVPEQQRAQNVYDEAHPDRQKGDTIKDAMATPGADHGAAVPGDRRGGHVPASAGARSARGRVRRRASPWRSHSSCSTWLAGRVGSRRACGSCPCAGWASASSLAGGTGAAAWLFGPALPDLVLLLRRRASDRRVPLASALLFDLGVFSLVVGATVLMLIALAHQSVRSHRAPRRAGAEERGQLLRWQQVE